MIHRLDQCCTVARPWTELKVAGCETSGRQLPDDLDRDSVAVKPHMTSFSTNLVVSDADCFVMVLPTFRSMGRPGRGGVGKVVVVY